MILFVDQSGQIGGAELCLADLAAHFQPASSVLLFGDGPFADLLRRRGLGVGILPLPEGAARATKRVQGSGILSVIPGLISHVWKLRGAFAKADIIYLNTAKALLLGAAANAIARRPCVFHLHDLWDEAHFSRRNIRVLVAAANRMDLIIANSCASAAGYRKAGGVRPVHVIPNGFDAAPFDAVDESSVRALRRQWNPAERPVAAVFGRLSRWKGQHLLIEAAKKIPELIVWVVGDALFTADDRSYAEELRAQAAELGDRVKFLGFREDIPELMKAADLVVHCSTVPEPFGRVVIEGMLSGKPVIASGEGGPAENIRDGVTGWLFSPRDSGALAAAIRKVIQSPDGGRTTGELASQEARKRYSLVSVLGETKRVLSGLHSK
jgi:glycosyltransferase involved in cell wall biosynthesis